jgi:hypothetical protein
MDNQPVVMAKTHLINFSLNEKNARPLQRQAPKLTNEKFELIKRQNDSYKFRMQSLVKENSVKRVNISIDNLKSSNVPVSLNISNNQVPVNELSNSNSSFKNFNSKKTFTLKNINLNNNSTNNINANNVTINGSTHTSIDLKRFQDILFAQKLKPSIESMTSSSVSNLFSSDNSTILNSLSTNSQKHMSSLIKNNISGDKRTNTYNHSNSFNQPIDLRTFDSLLTTTSVLKSPHSTSKPTAPLKANSTSTSSSSASSYLPPLSKTNTPTNKLMRHFSSIIDGTKMIDTTKSQPSELTSRKRDVKNVSNASSTASSSPSFSSNSVSNGGLLSSSDQKYPNTNPLKLNDSAAGKIFISWSN